MELIGFCDASQSAYAAVVSDRAVDSNVEDHVTLIASKTKVAPIQQITLPCLELKTAVLLARLMKKIVNAFDDITLVLHAWTDSSFRMVVLSPKEMENVCCKSHCNYIEYTPKKFMVPYLIGRKSGRLCV